MFHQLNTKIKYGSYIAIILALILTAIGLASSVDEAIVDATAPTGSVTLAPGASGAITINLSVTGNQVGTATFDVYRDWTLSGGTFIGSNPQTFTVPPRAAQDAATTFSTSGNVTVDAGQPNGDFILAVGVFNITNSNSTGAKLAAGSSSNYLITVAAPPPPSDTTPPVITPNVSGTLGNDGWYVSDVTVSWSVVDNESAVSSISGCDSTTINTDTTGTTLTCTATSTGGTSSQTVTIKRDVTKPTIAFSSRTSANSNGWNNDEVTVIWSCSDSGSGPVEGTVSRTVSTEGTDQSATGTCEDQAGNKASDTQTGISIDKTPPSLSGAPTTSPNASGWYNDNVTIHWTASDTLSGLAGSTPADSTISNEGTGLTASAWVSDKAGNTTNATSSPAVNIDKTAPTVKLVGGPANGTRYYFGSVPAAPTCDASDSTSGLDGSCSVSGYSGAVGSHTVTALAKDLAGNSASVSATYTVLAWTLSGFYQPVDMTPVGGTTVYNTVKGGSTVPLKFEVFAEFELTDITVVNPSVKQVACTSGSEDAVETTATGGTTLRYDWSAGQFIYNWQTPKTSGSCYAVTMTANDGSKLTAYFKLK
jgi:hypothetical protein